MKIQSCDMMSLPVLKRKVEMLERMEKIKLCHSFKIFQGSDGRWKTYILMEGKRKLIAKKSEEDLVNFLYDYYFGKEKAVTFKELFDLYLSYKKELVCSKTVRIYKTDYKRFFEGTKFERKEIKKLSEDDISVFMAERIKYLSLTKRAYEAMYGYLKSAFSFGFRKHLLDVNPFDYILRRDFYRLCTFKSEKVEDRTVSNEDLRKIIDKFEDDKLKKPNYIVNYAVRFASLTGMRVGEIAALRWDHVLFDKEIIFIDRAEVLDPDTKVYSINVTKNGKERYVPITTFIKELLLEVKDVEERYGYLSEYVFSNENGRIHKVAIGRCASNKSLQAGTDKAKPIHAYRRTINSKLKHNGVSTVMASSILGHTEEVNEKNYTYDISEMAEKRQALEKCNQV